MSSTTTGTKNTNRRKLKSYPLFYENMKPDLPEIRKTWPRPRYKLKTKSKNILEEES